MIKNKELGIGFTVFGGKGNVWSNSAHIYQSGKGNLCGTPALSFNHAKDMDACCPTCVAKYNELKNK
jgi:hypothetical protein